MTTTHDELLTVFEEEGVHGAVVKCRPVDHELADQKTGHFEPKRVFHTVARRFG